MWFRKKQLPVTIADFCRTYAIQRQLRANTAVQLQISVALLCRFAGKELTVGDLDERLLMNWLCAYSQHRSPSTVRAKRTAIMLLWRAAADADLCRPPKRITAAPQQRFRTVNAWRPDEVQQLISACTRLPRLHQQALPRSQWWELAIRVAWDTALRRGDQLTLEVCQIQQDGTFAITQSKTGRVVCCSLGDETLALLGRTLQVWPRRLVTPWQASRESFERQFRLIVKKAGVRPGTWKWLRRGSGTDVERLHPGCGATHLGHAPGSPIAERHYFDQSLLGRGGKLPTRLA